MAEEDMEKTSFITRWGVFYYQVMPFGLKNARATYQRAMTALFHDLMHQEVKVYVDDMIAKPREPEDHLACLKKLFDRLRKYKLRLNPNKCVFGVSFRKILGYIVSQRGIEVDPSKVRAIVEMPPLGPKRRFGDCWGGCNISVDSLHNSRPSANQYSSS